MLSLLVRTFFPYSYTLIRAARTTGSGAREPVIYHALSASNGQSREKFEK